MTTDELRDDISSIIYGADWKTELGEDAHLPQTEAIMELIKKHELKARIFQLDQLIDIEGKTFNRWTQKDIANFFDTVGKQYRELKKELEKYE